MRKVIAVAVLVLCIAIAGYGCVRVAQERASSNRPPSTPATDAVPAVSTAATAEPVAERKSSNEGLPINDLTAPDPKSVARKELLAIAHKSSGIPDKQYYVWQLLQQGTSAVGNLQGSESAEHMLVVFEQKNGVWTVLSSTKYLDAGEAGLKGVSPEITDALAERVDFVVPVEIDDFYLKSRSVLGQMDSGTPMYAPTRLPEGFAMTSSSNDGGSIGAEYTNGSKKLTCFAWISGEYGEGDTPKETYTRLRFDGKSATMDGSFYYRTNEGKKGPFLTAAGGYQVVSGLGASPGMVAAVAESMVVVP